MDGTMRRVLRGAAMLLGLAALGGCTPPDRFAPLCPQLSLVKDAADLTRFNGHGQDVTDLVLTGRIAAVPAQCAVGGKGIVQADLSVTADFIRGPANPSREMTVPYFVAVTDKAGRIIDKRNFAFAVKFAPNLDRTRAAAEPLTLRFPVSETVLGPDYHIYVGFALSADELAQNRRIAAEK